MKNSNWFNAMVEFRNTVKNIQFIFRVPRAIAQEIQFVACVYQDQAACEAIAKASHELIQQVGF